MSSAYRKPQTCWQHGVAFTGGMSSSAPERTAPRRTRSTVVATLVTVSAALIGVLAHQSLVASSSSSAPPPIAEAPTSSSSSSTSPIAAPRPAPRPDDGRRGDHPGVLGEADGVVPDGVTVFEDNFPAVAKLDPALLGALREAAMDAAGDRVKVYVNNGWRSPKYQEHLLREAIAKYGSEEEAARRVATPGTSAHVTGDAVDVGHPDAAAWLSKHGAMYGLCQIYGNEPWHYELRPEAIDDGCPTIYADPTHDPRMQP